MTSEHLEESRRLLRAAQSDLRAATALAADPGQENDVVGFHAQQAVEKAIKSILAAHGVEIPYTHDVGFLLDILAERPFSTPDVVAEADWLTPWAVAARYGAGGAELDRVAAVEAAESAVSWATTVVRETP